MLIRADGLLARPYPMAHNFEKLLSSSRMPDPNSPKYSFSHLSQQQDQPQEQPQEQPQPTQGGQAGASGAAATPVMQKWVFV